MPLLLSPQRRRPFHPWIGGYVGANGEGKNFFPCWESNTNSLIIQPDHYTDIFLNKGCFETGKFMKLAPLSSDDVWLGDWEML